MMMMGRLSKLLQIVSGGSSAGLGIRKSAGKQIGQLLSGSEDPAPVLSVLQQLMGALTSKSWEARMGGAYGMECVLEGSRHLFTVEDKPFDETDQPLDLDLLLATCPELVASGGTEFDFDLGSMSRQEFVKQQRQAVSQKLGLGEGMGMEQFARELVTDADLSESICTNGGAGTGAVKEMTARERAMMKRQQQRSGRVSVAKDTPNPSDPSNGFGMIPLAEFPAEWPLSPLLHACQQMLTHSTWHTRHGALLALPILLPTHLSGPTINRLAGRLVAVMVLDRFGDYNGDQVVAPVREAAAQTLARILVRADGKVVASVVKMVEWMLVSGVWQVRHGGLLCLKYLLAAEISGCKDLLCKHGPRLLATDPDDDIKGLSATLLHHHHSVSPSLALRLLQEADDSSTPVSLLLPLLHGVNDGAVKGWVGHASGAVRAAAFNALPGDAESVLMALQTLLLETDPSVIEAATSHASTHLSHLTNATSLIGEMCKPLSSPFDPASFIFYRPGLGKTLHPPAHQLGFKQADWMLLKEDDLLLGRRRAALLIKQSGASGLSHISTGGGEVEMMVAAWLGVPHPQLPLLLNPQNPHVESRGQILCLAQHARQSTLPLPADALHRLWSALLAEPLPALQQDIAHGLAPHIHSPSDLDHLSNGVDLERPVVRSALHALMKALPDAWGMVKGVQQGNLSLALVSILAESDIPMDHQHAWHSLIRPAIIPPAVISSPTLSSCLLALLLREDCPQELREEIILTLLDDDGIPAIAVISKIATSGSETFLPFVPLLCTPCMAWMCSSSSPEIRTLASAAFSALVPLLPLAMSAHPFLLPALATRSAHSLSLLAQLIGPSGIPSESKSDSKIQPYTLPFTLGDGTTLRPYQQEGLAWLMFLRRQGLHGVLADDMGLGKTLQTLCCLAADQIETPGQSLVICPASLVGHWAHEAAKYCPSLTPLAYTGSSAERKSLAPSLPSASLIICSYETARNDISILAPIHWSYVVLDEGHVIRNAKTKTAAAIKTLPSKHRLLLSGTPIQNNVLELWALFDFLMPGYLGDEQSFMARYAKPILACQPSTSNSTSSAVGEKEFEEAEKKLALLHRQVLPFILRRMKTDVLKDLPPKIIQDYLCDPSSIQKMLLEHLESTGTLANGTTEKGMHVFQALHYLRKVCVHPALVLSNSNSTKSAHPLQSAVDAELARLGIPSIHDLACAPKLAMLKELLAECGISGGPSDGSLGHRVLIFAQHMSTLDLVARDVLSPLAVPFLRIDGSSDSKDRFQTALRFNADPSIPILMLTTRVGGLGLNLTGADTVIFLEHDWNPQADLQAMDRAHRLGQTRTVTVYRLVMRGTLEEKILGLQAWKKRVAGTVVSQQNSTAGEHGGEILDLLLPSTTTDTSSEPSAKKPKTSEHDESGLPAWMRKVVESSGLAAADAAAEEYEQEFDLDSFVTKLKSSS